LSRKKSYVIQVHLNHDQKLDRRYVALCEREWGSGGEGIELKGNFYYSIPSPKLHLTHLYFGK